MGVKRITPLTEEKFSGLVARLTKMCESDAPIVVPSFKAQIEAVAEKIRTLIKKGYKYGDIAAVITEVTGVQMNVATLRNYVPKRKPARHSAQKPKAKPEEAVTKPEEAVDELLESVETSAAERPKAKKDEAANAATELVVTTESDGGDGTFEPLPDEI